MSLDGAGGRCRRSSFRRSQEIVALLRSLIGHEAVPRRGYRCLLGFWTSWMDGWKRSQRGGGACYKQQSCAGEDKAQSLVHWQYLMGAFSFSEGGTCPRTRTPRGQLRSCLGTRPKVSPKHSEDFVNVRDAPRCGVRALARSGTLCVGCVRPRRQCSRQRRARPWPAPMS